MKYFFIAAAIFVVGYTVGTYVDRKDQERTRISTCILWAAVAQGYRGDLSSLEAWQLFSPACSR